MKQDGGDRTENIDPEVAVAEGEVGLSCRAQQKLETSGERPRCKTQEKSKRLYIQQSPFNTSPTLCKSVRQSAVYAGREERRGLPERNRIDYLGESWETIVEVGPCWHLGI